MSGAPVGPTDWDTFAEVLDDRFVIVPPSGVAQLKPALLERFAPARGVMPGVRVEIRNALHVLRTPTIEVVRYEEWQLHHEAGNQRVSTAVFTADSDAPLGWSWLSLHETALPA